LKTKYTMPTVKSILLKNPSFKFWIIFLTISCFVVIGLTVNKIYQVKSDKEFIASTIPANATVLRLHNASNIEYEFTTNDGKNIKNTIRTNPSYIRTVNKGNTLTIFYDPFNPKESFLPQELKVEYFEGVPLIVFLFIIFVLGPAIAVIKCIKEAKIILNLFKEGTKAKAKIYEIKITSYVNGRPHSATINYFFHDKQGQQKQGDSKNAYFKDIFHFIKPESAMSFSSDFLPIPETELIESPIINILYNPKSPEENIWIDQYG